MVVLDTEDLDQVHSGFGLGFERLVAVCNRYEHT
jgi:aspartyl/asparaginyl-tRNA synthetase